jgi:hypothetical protein
MLNPVVEEYIFNSETELEVLSEPIRDETIGTKGGYWLIKILAKEENRQIDEADRDLLKSKLFDEWVSSLWEDPGNVVDDSYLNAETKTWAIEQATRG